MGEHREKAELQVAQEWEHTDKLSHEIAVDAWELVYELADALRAVSKRFDSDMIVEGSEDDLLFHKVYTALAKVNP